MLLMLSLALGLIAWVIPLLTVTGRQFPWLRSRSAALIIASFSACAIALVVTLFDLRHWIALGDWPAIDDVYSSMPWVGVILVAVTIVLNIIAHATRHSSVPPRAPR